MDPAIEKMLRDAVFAPLGEEPAFLPPAPPRPALARWTFEIGGFVPVNLNDSTGRHWSVKDKVRKSAADVIGVTARAAGVPTVSWAKPQVRRVRMAFAGWPGDRKMPDPDNLLKYQLDAMVTAFLLVDDSEEWCEWEKPTLIRSAEPKALIVLEDIEYKPSFPSEDSLPQMVRLLRSITGRMGIKLKSGIQVNPIRQAAAVMKVQNGVRINRAMRRKRGK